MQRQSLLELLDTFVLGVKLVPVQLQDFQAGEVLGDSFRKDLDCPLVKLAVLQLQLLELVVRPDRQARGEGDSSCVAEDTV